MSRPRLTLRARLTLLYTGLFALCGAIVVAVSYTLVAQLAPVQGHGNGTAGLPQRSVQRPGAVPVRWGSAHPDTRILAKCAAYLQQLGAQDSVT